MTEVVQSSLANAADTVRAAWADLDDAREEPARDDPEDARRYITALWRVQNAEDDYLRLQAEITGR